VNVKNTAASGAWDLGYTYAGSDGLAGSGAGTKGADGGAASNSHSLTFTGGATGTHGSVNVSDPFATPNSQTASGLVTVLDHASGSLSKATLSLPNVIVGYGTAQTSTDTLTVSNAAGSRVNLKTTGGGPLNHVTLLDVSGVVPGSSSSAVGATLGTGRSAGAISEQFTYTYADDSTLPGALSSGLGTGTVTVSGNVLDHASGALSKATLSLPNVIVGYGTAQTSTDTLTVSNAGGSRVNLKTTGGGTANSVTLLNASGVLPGTSSSAVSATLGTGRSAGTISEQFTYTYADDSTLPGALSSGLGIGTVTVSGNVLAHAVSSLSDSSVVTSDTLDFSTDTTTIDVKVYNYGYGVLQALMEQYDKGLTGSSAFSLVGWTPQTGIGTSPVTLTVQFDRTGLAPGLYSGTLTLMNRDQDLPGGLDNVGTLTLTLSGEVESSAPVPEPLSMGMLFLAVGGLGWYYRRKRRMPVDACK
jgi:hypothetical protein